jgi:putative sterol carrier protein
VYQRDFPYSAAKWEVEQFLDTFEPAHPEIAIARLRPSIVVGAPTVHAHGAMLARRLMFDLGPMPLVWDEDVADAVALALKQEARGPFNLTAEPLGDPRALAASCGLTLIRVPRAVRSVGAQLSALAAKLGLPDAVDPAWLRVADIPMGMSSDKARRELGWKPKCATPDEVIQRFLAENPSGFDARLELFVRLLQLGARRPNPDAAQLTGRVHLRLTGPGGGDLGLILDGKRLRVLREVPRPPTTTVTMKAVTFTDLLAGRSEYTVAQMTGRVRVEGEALAGMVVPGIITRFRTQAPARLQRLLFKGAAS